MKIQTRKLPEGVAAIVLSPVAPSEIQEGETPIEAMIRLRRFVVIRDDGKDSPDACATGDAQ